MHGESVIGADTAERPKNVPNQLNEVATKNGPQSPAREGAKNLRVTNGLHNRQCRLEKWQYQSCTDQRPTDDETKMDCG